MKRLAFITLLLLLGCSTAAFAGSVTVTESVSGSAHNWLLDFSVTNNVGAGDDVYFFGVKVGGHNPVGTPSIANPTAFDPTFHTSWDNSAHGDPTVYDNTWIDQFEGDLPFGNTLSGFEVLDTWDEVAPTNVPWFAYSLGVDGNPGFHGGAETVQTPEPGSMLLLGSGLFGLSGVLRRKRTK